MLQKARFIKQIIRDYGLSWVLRRGFYEVQLRFGLHRLRFPQRKWDRDELARWVKPGVSTEPGEFFEQWRNNHGKFLFDSQDREAYRERLADILSGEGLDRLVSQAEVIGNGEFTYFFKHKARLGFPPDWHLNPFTGGRANPKAHWSRLPMYSPVYGDMKFVWEPGRFASAFLLARASWASGRDFSETFWLLVESWREANPPNCGAHWKCGQEASLRLMAWYFGLFAFLDSKETSPERFALLSGMAAAQADRIERDHVYSHLQQNNHAMSEGVGLYVTGLLFPQFKRSDVWRRQGLKILEEEGIALIKAEGTFRQKSHNYHRLMLHLYLFAGRLAELNGDRFSEDLMGRLRNAGDYLYQVQDESTGYVPNFGANDGALVLPLNSSDYRDYRPVCAASKYFSDRTRIYPRGQWDEDLLWLFGSESLNAEEVRIPRNSIAKTEGGIYTIRGNGSWGFTHCEAFKERPGQADGLHFDLWWRGVNVTVDPGSYRYFSRPPWNMGLKGTHCHSTVMVDGVNQLQPGPRGMYTDWHSARMNLQRKFAESGIEYMEAEHGAYQRLKDPVLHRRTILRNGDDCWIVIDDLLGEKEHDLDLHWLLQDFPLEVDGDRIVLSTESGEFSITTGVLTGNMAESRSEVVRGTEESAPRGWVSHYYGDKEAAISLQRHYRGPLPCRLFTLFTPHRYTLGPGDTKDGKMEITIGDTSLKLLLGPSGVTPVIERVYLEDSLVCP